MGSRHAFLPRRALSHLYFGGFVSAHTQGVLMVASSSGNCYILSISADMLNSGASTLHLAGVDARVVAMDAA